MKTERLNPFESRDRIPEAQNLSLPMIEAWFSANTSIHPHFVDRKKFDALNPKERLVENPKGDGYTLVLPEGITVWDFRSLIENIDQATLAVPEPSEHTDPNAIELLGTTMRNAGTYIAERLSEIDEGHELAKSLAIELYTYGDQLLHDGKTHEAPIAVDAVATHALTREEEVSVEKWLTGPSFYNKQNESVRDSAEQKAARLDLLKKFFRISEQALKRRQKYETAVRPGLFGRPFPQKREGEMKHPPVPLGSNLLKKTEGGIQSAFEAPKREFMSAVLRRGLKDLADTIGIDKLPEEYLDGLEYWEGASVKLHDILRIDEWKAAFAELRQTQDIEMVAEQEMNFVHRMQNALGRYKYVDAAAFPNSIRQTQEMNCVGATALGSQLLAEVGVTHYVSRISGHVYLIVEYPDKSFEEIETTLPTSRRELNLDGASLPETGRGLTYVKMDDSREDYQHLELLTPEVGNKNTVIGWVAKELLSQERFADAEAVIVNSLQPEERDQAVAINLLTAQIKLYGAERAFDTVFGVLPKNIERPLIEEYLFVFAEHIDHLLTQAQIFRRMIDRRPQNERAWINYLHVLDLGHKNPHFNIKTSPEKLVLTLRQYLSIFEVLPNTTNGQRHDSVQELIRSITHSAQYDAQFLSFVYNARRCVEEKLDLESQSWVPQNEAKYQLETLDTFLKEHSDIPATDLAELQRLQGLLKERIKILTEQEDSVRGEGFKEAA